MRKNGITESDLVHKAKQALLSMQRYSWEQGVAAQGFLELGKPTS